MRGRGEGHLVVGGVGRGGGWVEAKSTVQRGLTDDGVWNEKELN